MKTENLIPTQWQLTTVKSINKGGVKKKHSRESRIVSKIYESALIMQNDKK